MEEWLRLNNLGQETNAEESPEMTSQRLLPGSCLACADHRGFPAPHVLGDPRRKTQDHFMISALMQPPLNYTNTHFNRVRRRPKPLSYSTVRPLLLVVALREEARGLGLIYFCKIKVVI